jgi:hypothetical protein
MLGLSAMHLLLIGVFVLVFGTLALSIATKKWRLAIIAGTVLLLLMWLVSLVVLVFVFGD